MKLRPPEVETIRVETASRLDAIDLARRLEARRAYLVQLADSRWHVCVQSDGSLPDALAEIRRTAEDWARERGATSVLWVGDRSYPVGS